MSSAQNDQQKVFDPNDPEIINLRHSLFELVKMVTNPMVIADQPFDGHDVRGIAKKYGLDVAALMDRLGYRHDNISMLFGNPLPQMAPPTAAPQPHPVDDRIQGNLPDIPKPLISVQHSASEALDGVQSQSEQDRVSLGESHGAFDLRQSIGRCTGPLDQDVHSATSSPVTIAGFSAYPLHVSYLSTPTCGFTDTGTSADAAFAADANIFSSSLEESSERYLPFYIPSIKSSDNDPETVPAFAPLASGYYTAEEIRQNHYELHRIIDLHQHQIWSWPHVPAEKLELNVCYMGKYINNRYSRCLVRGIVGDVAYVLFFDDDEEDIVRQLPRNELLYVQTDVLHRGSGKANIQIIRFAQT